MQWHMQVVSLTKNMIDKIDFILPEFSMTKIMTWDCHVDESTEGITI